MTGYLIRDSNIPGAWEKGLRLIWDNGALLHDQWGSDTAEILGLTSVVKYGHYKQVHDLYPFSKKNLEAYKKQLLSFDRAGFIYTYGNRMRQWTPGDDGQPINQVDYAYQQLRKSPNSRRAVATTWIPSYDTFREEVPCMLVTQYILRDNLLSLFTMIRSNDFFGAWPANVYGFFGLLEEMADRLGAQAWEVSTVGTSSHVYYHDWELWQRVLREPKFNPRFYKDQQIEKMADILKGAIP